MYKVITKEVNQSFLESGALIILKDDNILELCTILHLDQSGSWAVMGQSFDRKIIDSPTAELCHLVVTNGKRNYALKFNQWHKAIENGEVNSDKTVNVELIPATKFKKGVYIRECDCTASFMGGKGQYLCKKCNDKDVIAKILPGGGWRTNKSKPVKTKRPRMLSPNEAKLLATAAHSLGKLGQSTEDFEEWLEKQF